jgi:hypothetical protein
MTTANPTRARNLILTLALLFGLGLFAGFERQQSAASRSQAAVAEPELYTAEPGEKPGEESKNLDKRDRFWQARVTYPTGKFDVAWLLDAARHNESVKSGVPGGTVTYSRRNNPAPLALNPGRWTFLGPRPQESETCQAPCFTFGRVAGRTNDIVIDPISPTIAYIASDGGGIWKTTNCCTQATLWTPVTDDPLITGIAIGDMSIDASTHTVYAGTGDFRFGTFTFGSVGLLKSTDFGATWSIKGSDVFGPYYPEPVGKYPQYNAISRVEADPRNPSIVAAGSKTGLYISYNGGNTWSGPCIPDAFPTQRQDITAVLMHANSTNTATDIYIAVGARGISTTVQYNLAENGANGIYKSTVPPSGCPAAWSLISTPANGWPVGSGSGVPGYLPGGNAIGRLDLAMAPSNPSVIYAQAQAVKAGVGGAIQPLGQMGLWRTTDGGTTWEQRSSAATLERDGNCAPTCAALPSLCGDYPQNWYDAGLAVDPNDPNTFFMDTFDIWKSTDGGASFSDITCGYAYLDANPIKVHVDQHALAFLPGSSSTLLTGSDGGAYITLNANAPQPVFNNLNTTLGTIEFYGGDLTANFANSPAQMANAGAQDNGSSVWNGDPTLLWQQRLGGDGMIARLEPVLQQNWYFESQNGNLNVSQAGPYGPLTSAKGGWANDRLSFVFPYEIFKNNCPSDTGCTHLIAGSHRVWESTTGGTSPGSWYINSPDLTKGTLADRSYINQLSYAWTISTTALVGTNDGNVQYGFGLGQGTANTATWVDVTGGNFILPNRPVLDVTTDPANPLVGYAAVGGFNENTPSTPGHLFRVTCAANCATYVWANKSGNLPNIPVDAIAVNPNFRQQVFAGTDWGVYYTNDIDAATPEWFKFNAGMPNVMVWDFSIDRGATTLAAFTRSRGMWAYPLTTAPIGTPTPTFTGTPPTSTPTDTPRNTFTPTNTRTFTVSPTPTATSTPLSCGQSVPLAEGFESGTLGAFSETTLVGSTHWSAQAGVSNTGQYAAYALDPDEGTPSDQQLTLNNPVAIPANATQAYLHFSHRYSFENASEPFDGGVLELSNNNGSTWTDAGPFFTEGGYTDVITAAGGNPLTGREAWAHVSPGYPSFYGTTVNLTSFAGQTVKFRFRLGSDLNTGAPGWWIDDIYVLVTTPCLATFTPTATATSTPVLVGHVTWQGRPPQPNALQQLPITVTLKSNSTEVNYPARTTDSSGFFTVTLGNLPSGSYGIRVKNPKYLANSGNVIITGGTTTHAELGLMRAGDADDNNIVNVSDFNIMKAAFGKANGDPGYDDRADFTGDQIVNIADFNLVKLNFGTGGAPPLRPTGR